MRRRRSGLARPPPRLAPPELKAVHPLGKSPVIEDDGRVIAESGAIVLHPGPMNRDLEISSEAADGPRSRILKQVENGQAVRMSVLYHLLVGRE